MRISVDSVISDILEDVDVCVTYLSCCCCSATFTRRYINRPPRVFVRRVFRRHGTDRQTNIRTSGHCIPAIFYTQPAAIKHSLMRQQQCLPLKAIKRNVGSNFRFLLSRVVNLYWSYTYTVVHKTCHFIFHNNSRISCHYTFCTNGNRKEYSII